MTENILILLIFICSSLVIVISDIKTFHISLAANYIGLALCVITSLYKSFLFKSYTEIFLNMIGAMCLCFLFLIVRLFTHRKLGLGDIHYSLLCGFTSGFSRFLLSSLIASFLGILFFLFVGLFHKNKDMDELRVPFTPFMFTGNLICIIFRILGISFF